MELYIYNDPKDKNKIDDNEETVRYMEICNEINMYGRYRRLLNAYEGREDDCPAIVVVDSSPCILKNGNTMFIPKSAKISEAVSAFEDPDGSETPVAVDDAELSLGVWMPCIYDIYEFATYCGDMLSVPVPQVMFTNESSVLKGTRAITNERDGRPLHILLNAECEEESLLKGVAHEFRHIWQHKYHQTEYFRDYRFTDKASSLVEYAFQPAEIDAMAYASFMMITLGVEEYPTTQGYSKAHDKAVNDRIRELMENPGY